MAHEMWIVSVHEKSEQLWTTKRNWKQSVHVHRSILLTSTSLSLHKIRSTGRFHTGSSKKHFDFLKVKTWDVPPHNRGFAHLCDLFHNLWNWNIHLCDLFHNLCNWNIHICDLFHNLSNWNVHDLLQFSTFPINTKFHQLKHRLCVLLNHAVFVMDPFQEVTPQIRTNRTALDRRTNEGQLVWLNSRIPLVCSSRLVACEWTVGFPLSAPVARAVVTMSVSKWSDALWGHGQPNSSKLF